MAMPPSFEKAVYRKGLVRPMPQSKLPHPMKHKPPLGSGARFAHLKAELAHRPGVTNPAALAAYIGRKKLGAARFNALAAKGRRH